MTEKEKRIQRRKAEDAVFNRMLLCLLGAVIAEVVVLIVKRIYLDVVSVALANALYHVFGVFQFLGLALTVAGIVWCVLWKKNGKKLTLPVVCTAIVGTLWVIALLTYQLNAFGVRVLMALPAIVAVLMLIYFLYQRAFFVNAILTGGGLAALWLYRRYYMNHPTAITVCFVLGLIVLVLAALLAWKLRQTGGKLGKIRLMPEGSDYVICWLTCAVVAVAMILALLLGVTVAYYLLFVLVAWLFCQAVFFTVKLM